MNNKDAPTNIHTATLSLDQLQKDYDGYEPEFVLEPFIFKSGVNIIGGERGTGKTRLTIFIALAIAYGCDSVLGYPLLHHGNSLLLNCEMSEAHFKTFVEPMRRYFESQGLTMKHKIETISFKTHTHLKLDEIQHAIEKHKISNVFIDGYKAMSRKYCIERSLHELDNNNMDDFYNLLNSWRNGYGVSIVMTNHANKGTRYQKTSADLLYGPSALADYADQVTLIRKTNDVEHRLLIPDKSRFSKETESNNALTKMQSDNPTNPTKLWFDLIEKGASEYEHQCREASTVRHSDEIKKEAIERRIKGEDFPSIAKDLLGDKSLKGTVSKWFTQYEQGKIPL